MFLTDSRNLEDCAAVGLNMSSDFSDEWFTYRLFVRNATAEDLIDDKAHQLGGVWKVNSSHLSTKQLISTRGFYVAQ